MSKVGNYGLIILIDSSMLIHVEEIVYVPGLDKNVLLVTVLEDKGFSIAFLEVKVSGMA